jgi:hypothetical protein
MNAACSASGTTGRLSPASPVLTRVFGLRSLSSPPPPRMSSESFGRVGRRGRGTATHFKFVAIAWLMVAVGHA